MYHLLRRDRLDLPIPKYSSYATDTLKFDGNLRHLGMSAPFLHTAEYTVVRLSRRPITSRGQDPSEVSRRDSSST